MVSTNFNHEKETKIVAPAVSRRKHLKLLLSKTIIYTTVSSLMNGKMSNKSTGNSFILHKGGLHVS